MNTESVQPSLMSVQEITQNETKLPHLVEETGHVNVIKKFNLFCHRCLNPPKRGCRNVEISLRNRGLYLPPNQESTRSLTSVFLPKLGVFKKCPSKRWEKNQEFSDFMCYN